MARRRSGRRLAAARSQRFLASGAAGNETRLGSKCPEPKRRSDRMFAMLNIPPHPLGTMNRLVDTDRDLISLLSTHKL
jgi:hypothetical protein